MKHLITPSLLLSSSALALVLNIGCSGETGETPKKDTVGNVPNNAGTTPGGTGTGSTIPNGSSTVPGAASVGQPPAVGNAKGYSLNCAAPNVGATALRVLTRYEFGNTINDIFPAIKGKWTDSLPSSSGTDRGFDNDARAEVGNQTAAGLLETAESIGDAVVGALPQVLSCASTADKNCASQYLSSVGRRLFRRKLTQAETDRYLGFFDSALKASDFKTAIKWVTVGLIQSPNAVYRSEIGQASGAQHKLTALEQAGELSYMFTGSTPSEDLLSKAEAGNLGDTAALAKTLLSSAQGKQHFQRFFESYFGYSNVLTKTKPKAQDFANLSKDMLQETRSYLDGVVFQGNGTLKQLLTANTTNPSQSLASFYGFPGGSNNQSVQRPAGKGIGILAQGSFLASHAGSEASSPTQRGVFVYRKLFCQPNLTPPPGIPQLDTAPVTHTTRERYEVAHMTQGTGCNACHIRFDPIGFGFEHFDETGRFRDKEGDYPVDSAAAVVGSDNTPWLKFANQEELMTQIADQEVTRQCFAVHMASFAFGFDTGTDNTTCLGAGSAGANLSILDAYAALAGAPHFATRNPE